MENEKCCDSCNGKTSPVGIALLVGFVIIFLMYFFSESYQHPTKVLPKNVKEARLGK